jgi:hypothetical protein
LRKNGDLAHVAFAAMNELLPTEVWILICTPNTAASAAFPALSTQPPPNPRR